MPLIPEKNNIDNFLYPDNRDIGLEFYYDSRFIPDISLEDMQRMARYLDNPILLDKNSKYYKSYKSADKIKLKPNFKKLNVSLVDSIIQRKTTRAYIDKPINKEELSNILCLSYGIHQDRFLENSALSSDSIKHYFRTIPSPGALYPLEVYVVVIKVTDIPSGLYHYNIYSEELELLKPGDLREELYTIYHDQNKQLEHASAVFITTGVFQRVIEKYGKRGWRFLFIESGHLAQNFALVTSALKIGCSHIGGGYDNLIANFLRIDGIQEGVLYTSYIGSYDV